MDTDSGTASSNGLEVRRFPSWGGLREWVIQEAARAAAPAPDGQAHRGAGPLRILVPSTGAAWVLERALRTGLSDARSAAFPEVGIVEDLFRDLLGDLDPPFRLAPPLVREILMEEALLAGASDAEAPPGDPAQLADAFLSFLDGQAADRTIDAAQPAFEQFVQRAERHLGEARESDDGAARLLGLTHWLSRAHSRYLEALEAAARADADRARRLLFARAASIRPRFRGMRTIAVGEDALRPADRELLAELLPPGGLVLGLAAGAADPLPPSLPPPAALPAGGSPGLPGEPEPPARIPSRQATLFEPLPENRVPPTLFVPGGESAGLIFRATDREGEVRAAASLLCRFREESGSRFRGFDRCALAAQRPSDYRDAADSVLPDFGIPLDTREGPRLTSEPWAASLGDVLEFAANPGRLSSGIRMLRGPFFRDSQLPLPPPRCADILAGEAARAGMRDTNALDDFPRLAGRFLQRSEQARRAAENSERPERRRERAAALAAAGAALSRLTVFSGALAPLCDPDAGFRAAVEGLTTFLEEFLQPVEVEPNEIPERTLQILRQAAAAAPEAARSGGAEAFARRIRRLLNRRRLPGSPPPKTGRAARSGGVHLIAAQDAPFGDYDFLVLLGMVDADWPARRPQNILFPNRLLEPATRARERRRADQEIRLLSEFSTLPRQAAAFTRPDLEDGFPVGVSPLEIELVEASRTRNPRRRPVTIRNRRLGVEDEEQEVSPLPLALDRRAPSAAVLERAVSPSALDIYARSPAQFFARYMLRLEEESSPVEVATPAERGEVIHRFLERGYRALAAAGTVLGESSLDQVSAFLREEFRAFAGALPWSEAERNTEERWLFGGDATPGAMEWFLREEAERGPARPTEFEKWISGEVESAAPGAAPLVVEGRLDRLDLLDRPSGQTRRVVEYKTGRFHRKPLQARLYARILEANDGEPTDFAVPFLGSRDWIGPDSQPGDDEQDELIRKVRGGLARGDFPPPADQDSPFDFHLVIRRDLPDASAESAS